MNDRYLYRAKRTDNGEWVEGFLVKGKWYLGREVYAIIPLDLCFFPHCEISEWIEIDQSTICQCTGLKDKNGKLIWENDILNSGNLVVTWREELASYCLTKRGWMYQHFFGEAVDACDCEVIGNIFDNPELLGVGE